MESFADAAQIKIKTGKGNEFRTLAAEIVSASLEEDGCLAFASFQSRDDPDLFFLYEKWRDEAAIDVHMSNLQSKYGQPLPGRTGSGSRLPAKIRDFWEDFSHRFDVVIDD